jgi:putative peptide maturation dehydrogenase
MRLRRCAHLLIEPRERLEFDLALLVDGTGLRTLIEPVAIAPHLAREIVLSAAEAAALSAVSPTHWHVRDALDAHLGADLVHSLRDKGLLVEEGSEVDARDQRVRATHWRALSAAMHYASRWSDVDTAAEQERLAEMTGGTLLDQLGPAPPPVRERSPVEQRQKLPRVVRSPLDELLDQRVTCRNFDRSRAVSLQQFSAVLFRAYGARAVHDYAPGVQLLKKGVPSAGGLHATEAYLLVQHVDGVEPGLYHYHPVAHALELIRSMTSEETADLARRFVAAQAWFVDAHVLVIPTSRFVRTFWKYRNHAKAYRALILDVGHLSQTMYLAATELGLAAFITAAVNEIDIEQALQLDPLDEGPLAVCGFGWRATERNELEFDPLNAVWPRA